MHPSTPTSQEKIRTSSLYTLTAIIGDSAFVGSRCWMTDIYGRHYWTIDIEDESTTLFRNAGTMPINHPLRLGLNNIAVRKSLNYTCHFSPTLCSYHTPSRRKLNEAQANKEFPNFSVRILVLLWAGRPSNWVWLGARTALDPSQPLSKDYHLVIKFVIPIEFTIN